MLLVASFSSSLVRLHSSKHLRANARGPACPHRSTRAIRNSRNCQSSLGLRMAVLRFFKIVAMFFVLVVGPVGNFAQVKLRKENKDEGLNERDEYAQRH